MPEYPAGILPSPVLWRPDGSAEQVPIEIFHTIPESGAAEAPLILFHGNGEGRKSSLNSLEYLAAQGIRNVASVVMPYDQIVMPYDHEGQPNKPLLEAKLRQTAVEAPQVAARHIKELAGVDPDQGLRAAARSGGGMSLVLATSESDDNGERLFDDIALIGTVGVAMDQLGTTTSERKRELGRRLKANGRRQALYPSNWGSEISGNIADLRAHGILSPSLRVVASEDITRPLVRIAGNGRKVLSIIGSSDRVVQSQEQQMTALERVIGHKRVELLGVAGGHASSASRRGLKQLRFAIRALEQLQSS